MAKLDVKALGLSLGILWGVWVFLMGILSMTIDWSTKLVDILSSLYVGYNATLQGSLIGGVWGFIDGAICGVLIAWLYNKLTK